MARLTVALLGPLHVTLHGESAGDFGYDKVRALLAYLLLEGERPLRRDTLAALLWPDAPASAARKSLRTALATLRQAIGDTAAQPPVLRIERDTIRRHPHANVLLDVAELRAHLAAVERHAHTNGLVCDDCAERLAQAAALYRGPFLQQISLPDSVAWEEWALLTRERLHGQLLDALAQLMAYHEARGEDERARQYAWRALQLEGWAEAAHRCLMRVYARSGQRGAALAQYERCRKLLAEELGIAPAAETTALYERICAGPLERTVGDAAVVQAYAAQAAPPVKASEDTTPASNLPIPPPPLIGRADAVDAAATRLRQPDVRLLTLIGPPGVGKTRLALAVAEALIEDFADGVYFVALAPIRDPALVASAIAHVLGVQEAGDQSYSELLRAFLHGKSLLLLLDNFEHVLETAPLLAELLSSCADLKLLVTSRAALELRAERRWPVAPLALPDQDQSADLAAVASAPAIALFLDRAQAVKPNFTLGVENAADVTAICRRLDGLPLAIELAAARSNILTPEALLRRLTSRLALLTNGKRDAPDRQQTLRLAIAWSYDLLNAVEQALFRRLGVFVGGWTIEAAEAVASELRIGCPLGDEELKKDRNGRSFSIFNSQFSILDGLAALVEQSLVQQVTDTDGEPRFMLLETIREYALEQLLARGEASQAQDHHAGYYLALAESAAPALTGPEQRTWFQRLEREHGNLRAALHWVYEHGHVELLGRLTAALRQFWYVRGHFSEGWDWFEAALAQRDAMSKHTHAKVLYAASWLARVQRDFGVASALIEESLYLYYALEDKPGIALALGALGTAVFFQGDPARGTTLLEQSLALSHEIGHKRQIAMALCHLGLIAVNQGNFTRATALFEKTLIRARELGDQRSIGDALGNLGLIALARGDAARAWALLEQSLAIYRALQDNRLAANMLNHLGTIALAQSEYAQARRLCEQSLDIFREVSHTGGIAQALRCLGEIAAAQGSAAEARALLEESLALSHRLRDKPAIAECLNSMGRVALCQGNIMESLELHRDSLMLFRDLGNGIAIARVLEGLASVAVTQMQPTCAARLWGAAERLREAAGTPMSRHERGDYECNLAASRTQLDADTFAAAWQAGRTMTIEETMAEAFALDPLLPQEHRSQFLHQQGHED